MNPRFYSLLILVTVIISCNKTIPKYEDGEQDIELNTQTTDVTGLRVFEVKAATTGEIGTEYSGFIAKENELTGQLLKSYLGTDEPFILSPLSIQLALDMLYPAADGETAQEIANVVGLDADKNISASYASAVIESLACSAKDVKLAIGNLCVADKRSLLLDEGYEKLIGEKFYAPVAYLDFGKPEQVVNTVNKWCERQTEGLIPALFGAPDDLKGVLYLLSSLLCKGGWSVGKLEQIGNLPFYQKGGEPKDMPMLGTSDFLYLKTGQNIVAGLTLGKERRFEYDIFMPEDGDLNAAADLISKNEAVATNSVFGTLKMPEFSTELKVELKESLERLGMHKVFTQQAELPALGGNAYVEEIFQKAKISVGETGLEAAAVTVVEVFPTDNGPGQEEPEPVYVTIDHPFVYVLRDRVTGLILFAGAYTK